MKGEVKEENEEGLRKKRSRRKFRVEGRVGGMDIAIVSHDPDTRGLYPPQYCR